jgi:H+/Cl- antiporter ClcA
MAPNDSNEVRDQAVDLVTVMLFLIVLAIVIYFAAAFMAVLGVSWLSGLKDALSSNAALTVGLPTAAIGAFGVVALLLHSFPPEKVEGGVIKIKFFSAEFSGPAGPITLWLACFLSFVAAIKALHL